MMGLIKKINLKGSYTIEASIIVPMFLFTVATGMKISMSLYNELKKEKEYEITENMDILDKFYAIENIDVSKK